MIDASLAVWWITRNGRSTMSGRSRVRSHATEYIFDNSICSSSSISGSIPAIAFASIVLPDPGGHCMRILCPHAAAISRARFACSCPMISEKSGEYTRASLATGSGRITHGGIGVSPVSISTTSERLAIPMTSISGITDASRVLSTGRNTLFIPSSLASIVAGRAHWIGLTSPSRASSHKKSDSQTISVRKSISLPNIPSAIGRS